MYNPFQETIIADVTDEDLVLAAQHGDWNALEQLIGRHQAWIFNIAVRMVHKPQEAEDITQEVLLKMLTKLGTFQGKSSFRTWLYRIVANHVLNLGQRPQELTFSELGTLLEHLPDAALPDPSEGSLPPAVLVEEAKVTCTLGMLLCLDPRQRLVFILGEVCGVSSELGADLLELSPSNFRQVLSRARRDLYNYLHERCGLINQANPCRCARKTRSFIQRGYVDPQRRRFTQQRLAHIAEIARDRTAELHQLLEQQHASIYREHPFLAAPDFSARLHHLITTPVFRQLLLLDA